ncbi:focadhesin [Brienomyrus brachyistius]|uniref:focadhesin n=1 Tax=Brienomyrus brachyistius TaxID=42636 RepID=UPI0020B32AE9|nr:focadhesin [Brienomyrus brachyistius]XP_048826035.1 focadhesin [Brienomyrus brachyistius]XP_048826036.1 focadhesin [Brienomyrus brachyistius]XP_048826037.1 focadhesin [Brienomyrus brachyistius]XP_048826038.1 focadhesin [Brienomyrus brachyistius]XP_048826039.1 focadhesin [Brienomyrus brachyistius]XP_048826040.1 focadhesin [Brienomyrus brachyistius]XP_048826041.1 focadhesin [Brienomyrus brachyistius]XP_048826042.1 focadhesin [Brienomyrus brachyistius]
MADGWKNRFEFPSPLVQAQAVRSLLAGVLKEKGRNEKIVPSSNQNPLWESLWEHCSGEAGVVRSACCDALVLLVEQGHADPKLVLAGVLNLVPSARNVQGLMKVLSKLMQIQVDQDLRGDAFTCPYSIRNPPHPFITVLENRPDCWPWLLQEVDDFVRRAALRKKPAYVAMLVPFLRFLYCGALQAPEHALLRLGLLRALLPARPDPGRGGGEDSGPGKGEAESQMAPVTRRLILCLLELVPHMQVDSITAVLELSQFIEALCPTLLAGEGGWGPQCAQLALQLLCACHLCLELGGDCSPLLRLIQRLLPACSEAFPTEQVIVGVALLLRKAPASQQTAILTLASKVVSSEAETCPSLAPVLLLPLLEVLSCSVLTEALTNPETRAQNQQLARSLLEAVQKPTRVSKEDAMRLPLPLCAWYSELLATTMVVRRLGHDPVAACGWLRAACSALPLCRRVPDSLALLLAYLVATGNGDDCRLALDAVALAAQADPAQVPGLLLVLMLKLGRASDPELSHAVLYTLPKLGTHKFCVPQLLQAMQMLSSAPKLRAVALRLMTAFWEKQDRVYPQLLRLMAQTEQTSTVVLGKEDQWEQILARAACVRDVCRERPYQHGGDMLAAITDTITQCSGGQQAAPVALALQGLRELCRAEVVDIRSTWAALSPRLACDSRPLVAKGLAELFSLVPLLSVKTEDYEKFKAQIVSILWAYALDKNPEVASAGYRALAEFPENDHTVLHLPEPARPPKPEPTSEEEEDEGDKEEDLSVPGPSYVKLLLLSPMTVHSALEGFLTSLVRQEMAQMPRGVYHSVLRGGGSLRSNQGKAVAGIPGFMLKTHERNKQPGLKSGLAAGLLLCYELPVQTDRDGRPISRFLVSRGRSYQQMLATLIHEVNIQPSEWHRSLLLPQAWLGFMGRTYHAVLQGRRAELEMLQKQGKGSLEELQVEHHNAWLWVRDQLMDVLKSAAKDGPVVQGNSILALSGLAATLAKYESTLPIDPDGDPKMGSEFLPARLWMSMVLETLWSVVSSRYQPRANVFPWFQHRSYTGGNTAGTIARSCASLGLSLLVPVLLSSQRDTALEVLGTLESGLPGGPAADESQAVQFHTGLALGMFLCHLHEEGVSEVSGQKLAQLLMSSLDTLEARCFDSSLEYNTGCILGVGLVLSSLTKSGRPEDRSRVVLGLERLRRELADSESRGRMVQEVLAYAVACTAVSAFNTGLIDGAVAEETMNGLRQITEESQQTPGFALALGLTVHGLSTCGHGKAEDLHGRLLAAWIKILLAEGCPTMQRLAAANGLVALAGSESILIQLKCESGESSQHQARLNEVIRAVTQIVTYSSAIGLQCNASCLLGHLHLTQVSANHNRAGVPPDFGYLPERSVIRATVDYISDAGKKGPEFAHPKLVKVALGPLVSVGASFQYPPVNWSTLLAPLMRLNFGEDVQHHCIELAVGQSQTSQSAALFLGTWLSPPLVHSLSPHTRGHLYRSLPLWMKHVPAEKLQSYVSILGVQQVGQRDLPGRGELCRAVLEGLAQAMALPDPTQDSWAILRSTTEAIFQLLPEQIQESEADLYVGISKCLSEMKDTEIERITRVTEANLEKTGFVLAYLCSQGHVPLLALNDVIATALPGHRQDEVTWMLTQSFYQCCLASNPNTDVLRRMEWLLELMGLIRNVAYGTTSVNHGEPKQATGFLLRVFSAAVLTWADHAMPLLQGVGAIWAPRREDPEVGRADSFCGVLPSPGRPVFRALLALPHSLQLLLTKEPWKGQTQKFLDWLFSIAEGPTQSLSESSVSAAKAAIAALRNFPEFRKKAVWARAYGW